MLERKQEPDQASIRAIARPEIAAIVNEGLTPILFS